MNKLTGLFVFFLILSQFAWGQKNQTLLEIRDALFENEVYTPGKNYKYNAVKINEAGDTLSNEVIWMKIPKALNPEKYEDGKIYFIWEYDYSSADSVKLSPMSNAVVGIEWNKRDTTTMRLNQESLYLHPVRDNQYYQVEVSSHPTINFEKVKDGKYRSRIVVLKGFGIYNMKQYISYYELVGESSFELDEEKLKDCYEIKVRTEVEPFSMSSKKPVVPEKTNDKLSTANYTISKSYGFVRMEFEFYDGEQLFLKMIKE